MDTKKFWEMRLSKELSLKTTGHRAFNLSYNQWLYQAQVECLDMLLDKHSLQVEGASILDLGSGGGFFVDYFKQKGAAKITGVDIAKPSVEYLREKYPDSVFYHADISDNDLPFFERYSIISIISVMFHIVDDGRFTQALSNICSLTESGGYIILCDTFERSWLPSPKHVRMRGRASYETVFKDQGVRTIDLIPMYYLLNRVFIPYLGPKVINLLDLGRLFYAADSNLRRSNVGNLGGMKLLLAKKD